jgi:hypothetical protein
MMQSICSHFGIRGKLDTEATGGRLRKKSELKQSTKQAATTDLNRDAWNRSTQTMHRAGENELPSLFAVTHDLFS